MSKLVVSKLSGAQGIIERFLASVAMVVIVVMAFLTGVDVFLRYVFNSPIPGTFELEEFLLVSVVYLTFAYIQFGRGHIRLGMLVDRLSPRVQTVLNILAHVICLVALAIVTWQSSLYAYEAWVIGDYSTGLIKFPLWPAKSIIPVGCGFLCLRLLSDILHDSRYLRSALHKAGEDSPR